MRRSTREGAGRAPAAFAMAVVLLRAGPAPAQVPTPVPPPCPQEWRGLLGLYGSGDGALLVLERDGALRALVRGGRSYALEPAGPDRYRFPNVGPLAARDVAFARDASSRATALRLGAALLPRDTAADGLVVRFSPVRPLDEVVRQARAASPPADPPEPLREDLVDPTRLDRTLRVELRYSGVDNELGARLVETPRAFLRRPAAEALVRAHRSLAERGLGLVVRDAFHPWWVTKAVWEAAPAELRRFLADPAEGSGYDRGTTVDVTLFRLADGSPCELPSAYGDVSLRSFPDFPGGTSEQRFYRDLLLETMEVAGLTSSPSRWWRYDLPEGRRYPVLNEGPAAP